MKTERVRRFWHGEKIPIGDLVPRKGNRAEGGLGDLEGLSASIAEKGVLQQLIVRAAGDGKYEIVAGERRWRAAQLAGLEEVPVSVVECDDREAEAISVMENIQREDLDPMDEALEIVRLLEAWKTEQTGSAFPVPEVAARIGRSETYVRQRASLANLSKGARKRLRAEAQRRITVAHALVLARIPAYVQDKVIKNEWMLSRSPRELQDWIAETFLMDLDGAPFDKDDAELVPRAGACSTCPKRSSSDPGLFPEIKRGQRCLDHSCYSAKLDFNFKKVERDLKTLGSPFVRVATDYGNHGEGVLNPGQWVKAPKNMADSVRGLVVNGPERGKIFTVVEGKLRRDSETGDLRPAKLSDEEKAVRRGELLERKIASRVRHELFSRATEAHGVLIGEEAVIRIFAQAMFDRLEWGVVPALGKALGWKPEKNKGYGGLDWRGCAKSAIAALSGTPELFTFMAKVAAARAIGQQYSSMGELNALAKAVGVDAKAVEREVRKEFKGKKREKKTVSKKRDTRGSGRKAKPAAKGKRAVGRKARG